MVQKVFIYISNLDHLVARTEETEKNVRSKMDSLNTKCVAVLELLLSGYLRVWSGRRYSRALVFFTANASSFLCTIS